MSEEKRISAGLYIGHGPKPENVEADMYVDMEGKNVGVYIGGGQPKTLGEILEQAVRDNPSHASELQGFLNKAGVTPREQMKPLLKSIADWANANAPALIGATVQVLCNLSRF